MKLNRKVSKFSEKVARGREARYRLIQLASAGDKEARRVLAGPPYRLRVYTPEERQAYVEAKSVLT